MKTNKIKKQGFHEDVDPLMGKARKHSIVAQRNKFDKEQISDTVEIVPGLEELTLRFDNSEGFLGLVDRFIEETDIFVNAEAEGNEILVKLLADEAELFLEFLAKNGIKPKEDDVTMVKSSDIIALVQNEISKRAISKDKMISAEKVGRKENASDLIQWVKNPGKSDL